MVDVDAVSFLVIVVVSTISGLVAAVLPSAVAVPVVVLELVLGVVVGPQVLDLAEVDKFTQFFGNLGLGMLFFFAGYEIDFGRIRGRPLLLAALGWALSLALAYGLGGALAAAGIVVSLVYTGSAMATTAIGTLIPILGDAGELRTKMGTYLLAAGAVGEFGPILLITLVLSTEAPLHEAVVLAAFVVLAVITGIVAVRSTGRGWSVIERTLHASSQLAVRFTVVLVFGLVALAVELGLDLLLGGFVAGLITRAALRGREVQLFESKVTAVGYGFLIPFFFVLSGMKLDVDSLFSDLGTALEVPMFLALFLLVRGLPALLLYRRDLDGLERRALALFSSTQLPLVVAITTVAMETGNMRASTAASLVGAAALSTLIFPLAGLHVRRRAPVPAESVG